MDCRISVIIPIYNAHDYLERCLDSVCNQTLKDIEVIAVDDCSTDDSLEILQRYAEKYPQLRVIAHKTNGGESRARNTGLDNATGEYLAFVDNDDSIDPDFLEKLYEKAKETNADIVKGEAHILETDNTERYDGLNQQIRKHHSKLFFSSYWWTAIYKKSLINKNNIRFLEGYLLGGDVLFLNETILKCNKLDLVDGTYYNYYRRDDSGDSKILTREKVESVLNIHEKILENTMKEKSIQKDIEGLKHIYSWCFRCAMHYAYRNKTEQNLRFCIDKTIKFYSLTKEYVQDRKILKQAYPIVLHYIQNGKKDELIEFYLKNSSPQKMFLANLRFLHSMKVGENVDRTTVTE